jgi:hypothetical protein
VLAIVMFLLGWYVASYGAWRFLAGRATASAAYRLPMERFAPIVFEPVYVYQWSEMPGDCTLRTFGAWCYYHGEGRPQPWGDIRNEALQGMPLPDR